MLHEAISPSSLYSSFLSTTTCSFGHSASSSQSSQISDPFPTRLLSIPFGLGTTMAGMSTLQTKGRAKPFEPTHESPSFSTKALPLRSLLGPPANPCFLLKHAPPFIRGRLCFTFSDPSRAVREASDALRLWIVRYAKMNPLFPSPLCRLQTHCRFPAPRPGGAHSRSPLPELCLSGGFVISYLVLSLGPGDT